MLAAYFGFKGEPFDDPSSSAFVETNLFLRGVAAQLLAGIVERKGLMLVLGDPASGRKLLLDHLIGELRGRCRIVNLASVAGESFDELLMRCCAELGIAERATDRLARARLLVNHFIAQIPEGRNTVLVVDEAHHLDEDGLRNLFLLSELGERKPVQVILAGGNELGGRFAAPDLAAILRGIGLTVRLPALKTADFDNYVRSQLQRAGAPDLGLFDGAALERLTMLLRDAPELVARLSNQALVITQLEGLRTVTAEIVDQAGHAVFAPPKPGRRPAESVEVPPVTIERPARAAPTSVTGGQLRPATATGSPSGEPAVVPVAIARPAPTAAPKVLEPRPVFVDPASAAKKSTEARVADAAPAPPKRRGVAMLAGAGVVGAALVGGAWLLIEQLGRIDARPGPAPFATVLPTGPDQEALGRITTAAGSSIAPATSEMPTNEAPQSEESAAAPAPIDSAAPAASASSEPTPPAATETAAAANPPPAAALESPRAAPPAASETAPAPAAVVAAPTIAAATPGLAASPIPTTSETEPSPTAAPQLTAAEPSAADPAGAPAAPVVVVAAPSEGTATSAANEAALPSPTTPAADPAAAPPIVTEPSPPPPAPPPAASRTPPPQSAADEQMMKRGNALLLTGDFAGARLFFERAAAGGNPRALTAVGKTYDPLYFAEAGFPGSRGEPERAAEWYKKAAAAGDIEAATRLRRLQSRR